MVQPAVPTIAVGGNVEGSIVVGDNNFVVNTNHGTIIYNQTTPRIQLRGSAPRAPRRPRGFLGRSRELSVLEGWIAGAEPVFISGPDGIGKTSLAKQAANGHAAGSAPNGVLYVEGVDEGGTLLGIGDLVQRMFDALFESEPPLKVDLASARTYLSNTKPLLLLSGATLPAEAVERLPDLFPAAPIIVETTEQPGGEAYQALALGPLEPDDAVAVLADRSGVPLDEANRPGLAEIAGLLGNVPAALVTVGNAIRADRLIPAMTAGLLRGVQPASSDPVQAATERAYRAVLPAMSDVERGMLAQAAAAPGMSIDRAWMESRFGDKPVAAAEDLGMLFPLSPRLRLVPGLREIALEGFDRDKLRESLYEHLATLLNERWLDFDLVQDELGNLLGLLEWAAGSGRHKIVLYLARVLEPYLTLRGLWGARGRALTHLLDSSAVLQDAAARAWGLHQLGVQRLGAGELDQARAMFQQSRDLRLSLGDTEGAAYSQHNLDLLAPPSAPPGGNQAGGGGLAPWGKALLIGGLGLVALLAAGIIGTVAIGGVLSQTPAPTPLPPTDVPTWTPSPPREPTETETITPTPSPSPTPDLLGWRLVPVGNNLSEQAPTACFLSMTVPEIVGTENLEVLQFNAVVEEFVKAEAGRASQELLERFTSEGCPSSEIGWFSDYRVTTWPEDNYLGIEPVEMAAESAVFPSSHLLLSILMLSTYTTPEFTYPPLTYSINYDLNMGRELALEDLFAPGRPYLTRLSLLANETLVGRGLLPEYAKIVTEPRPENYQTWNLTHFGLLMTFNDQQNGFQGLEIGTQRVLIPYRLLADILDPAGPLGDLASQ